MWLAWTMPGPPPGTVTSWHCEQAGPTPREVSEWSGHRPALSTAVDGHVEGQAEAQGPGEQLQGHPHSGRSSSCALHSQEP